MRNGPVVSNISLINKAFLELGSPLHYKLIVDYLRVNWDHGKGIKEEEAKKFLDLALEAKYYYEEVEEQHYQRKQTYCSDLDPLYEKLKREKIPFKYNSKTTTYKFRDLNSDSRFTIMTTKTNEYYVLLSEWNLLNELAVRLFVKEKIKNISIFEAVQLIKKYYDITDENALFLPHFDHRFIIDKNGKVSLRSYDDKLIQNYTVEITDFIREEVARLTPKMLDILEEHYGNEVKIRSLINSVFKIETHTPKFSAYFVAVKEHLPSLPHIYLTHNEDSVIYIKNVEKAKIVDKVYLYGRTDQQAIAKTIEELHFSSHNDDESLKELKQNTIVSTTETTVRKSLTYTIRYYDRIQETLSASYFKDWIKNDELIVQLKYENETSTLIFLYDKEKNLLYGPHLENLMSDYALIPGQKLHFQRESDHTITLRIGHAKETDIKEQERYIDIARLVQENKFTSNKSLLQIVTEILMYHPSGLHLSEITRLVKEEAPYADSSISAILSTKDYFEKIPGQSGFWRFNPAKWKKNYMKDFNEGKPVEDTKEEKKELPAASQNIKPMHLILKDLSNQAKRQRITNEMYFSLDKDTFLMEAWLTYAKNIYRNAKKFASPSVPLEDLYQEAYFALIKAYDNYDPIHGTSFYNYFKIYLTSVFMRYIQNNSNFIRIPVHRLEELEKWDKQIESELLKKGELSIQENPDTDYYFWKIGCISFEELYIYEKHFEHIDDEELRGRVYLYFSKPHTIELLSTSKQKQSILNVEEPENTSFNNMLVEDEYDYWEENFFENLWNFVDQKAKSIPYSEVLKQRYGFNEENTERTLEEIGQQFGVTRERIRQIENRALQLAKEYCLKHGYTKEIL